MLKKILPFVLVSLPLFAQDEAVHATESYEYAFLKMLAMLGLLVLLLGVTFWLFRRISSGRLKQSNQSRMIKIVERRALSPKSMLYVVEFAGKQVLIAESQLEVRKIDEKGRETKLSESE